jgi:hypothetical protein
VVLAGRDLDAGSNCVTNACQCTECQDGAWLHGIQQQAMGDAGKMSTDPQKIEYYSMHREALFYMGGK